MSTASAKSLRSKLVRKAYENPDLREKLIPLIKKASKHESKLTSSQRANLAEAIRLARGDMSKEAAAKLPTKDITTLPTMSPVQVRTILDNIVAVRQAAAVIEGEVSDQLKKLKDLSNDEKKGVDQIKKAGTMLSEKINYCLETEKAVLKFQAAMQSQPPGIAQLLASPEEVKPGEKAGDLLRKINSTFEKEVAGQIVNMIEACIADATHMKEFVKALKIVAKTSSVPQGIAKNAGLVDTVVGIKEWLVGGANSIMQRILGFAGDIKKWVMGFVERSRIAKNSRDKALKGLDTITKAFDTLEKQVA